MEAEKIRILILAANPWNTDRLDLGDEYQRIQDLWENSDSYERFDVRYNPALRGEALQKKVLKFKPHLIHFSGHGEADSLIFTDLTGDKSHEVSKQALAKLFGSYSALKAVFLNACYSANQAKEIVEQVDYVIGMNAAINDSAAIRFAEGFYTALFSQDALNIEQAFNAGLTQMALVNIAETEQKKPVLQKRRHTYVPSYQHDIFISFADEDEDWADNFINGLRKQLQLKLATFDGFQFYTGTDFSQLEQSAILLIIYSPDYYQQYQAQFEQLGAHAKQQPVFLIEKESHKLHDSLKGLSRYKFWVDDDQQGIISLQGDAYIAKANQIVELVAKQLQELRTKHQLQQNTAQQRQQQQNARGQHTQRINAFIFLHSAPEDLDLTRDIVPLLEENGIDYVLPLTRSVETTASDIRQDIENNILNCDAVLILYEQTSPVWVREQLGTCRRLQGKRDTPLKIIAVYKNPNKSPLEFKLENLKIYPSCSPAQISEFVEALA